MAVFTLTLIRHGETTSNKDRILQGQKNTLLSEKGKQQADLCGQRLQLERFSHVYCSDLSRAVQTCEYILKRNKVGSAAPVHDKRLRERGYGIFEGKPAAEFQATVKRQKCDVTTFTPPGGESIPQVRSRAREFFLELCAKLKAVIDSSGPDGGELVGGKRKRNPASVGSDVFPSTEQELLTAGDTYRPSGGHTNTGSTSSGCSSIAADSDQSTEPSENSQDVDSGAPLSPDISPSQESSGSSFSGEEDHVLCPLVDTEIRSGIAAPRGMQAGCPNVSLSPIFEHRLSSISSISSGRNNSFDDGDTYPALLADVLIVAHGGIIKQLIAYFIDELGCKVPGGKETALQVCPNTGISKFTVSIGNGDESPKVTCLSIHDKDHLMGDAAPLEKLAEFYA